MARALQVISTGGMYGAERVLLELSRFLNDNGWDSQILAIDGAGAAPLVAAARRMGMRAELFGERDIGAWSGAKRLASYLEEHSIDLVHSHGYKPDILLAASGQPRRRVCVATCHSWYSDTLKMRAYEWLDKRCLRFFDQVVAVSDEILQDLLGNAVSAMRLSMISNGLDAIQPADQARLVIRRQLEVGPEELLVVRVGRLMATKGNDLLLRALASLNRSDWRLAFVGAGDQQPVLEALAASLDVAAKVRFCGFQDNVADYLAAADLFVSPSLQEGLPMVLLEAMAAGLPILSTSVGQIPKVMQDDHDGLLIAPGEVDALHAALARLMASPWDRERWSAQARRTYAARFSRGAMGGAYLRLYDDALQRSQIE